MKKPILIVEDDTDGQALISHICEFLNIPYEVVGDAENAARRLFDENREYALAIIDLALPGQDGWQLLSAIRDTPSTENLTCVAVTAFHTSKTREEALLAGFDAYFAKPLDPTHFARELEGLL
ncbi:MAG: hypothetical protein CUN55_02355 [Phototrophicales bacterium]|nr:MAG: hypothetical protein CUN55_02355 [Phototrophicales bacterium]